MILILGNHLCNDIKISKFCGIIYFKNLVHLWIFGEDSSLLSICCWITRQPQYIGSRFKLIIILWKILGHFSLIIVCVCIHINLHTTTYVVLTQLLDKKCFSLNRCTTKHFFISHIKSLIYGMTLLATQTCDISSPGIFHPFRSHCVGSTSAALFILLRLMACPKNLHIGCSMNQWKPFNT